MDEYNPDDIAKAEALEQAANDQRRAIVDVLLEEDGEYDVETLASEVIDRTRDRAGDAVDSETHRQVEVALTHHHLPKLAEDAIVEFDVTERTVAPGDHIDDMDPLV